MIEIDKGIETARAIGDVGMMAVTAAFFLVLATMLMIACFKWFKTIINNMLDRNSKMIDELLNETRNQNSMLLDISEGLRPETQLRIKNTSGIYFDYAVEKVCRMVKKVREENHIADREATQRKIRTLLINLHDDRNSRFDYYTYRGKRLASYTSPEWVDWVAEVVENEVYAEIPNNGRCYTNIQAVYDRIKLDFYHKMNQNG